jgi:hypothetical protein
MSGDGDAHTQGEHMKTSELTGAALDWAVAQAEDFDWYIEVKPTAYGPKPFVFEEHGEVSFKFQPSSNWSQGGPIIEREKLDLEWIGADRCRATYDWLDESFHEGFGPTPLIAAMRCYCCAKLGDEIDIPEELCQQQSS